MKSKNDKQRSVLFLYSVPFIIFFIAFNYVPLMGWMLSFLNYKPGIPLSETQFVGLKYFALIIKDGKDTIRVLTNTIVMNALLILFSPLPVVFAIFLNEIGNNKIKRTVQTFTTLPNFISWVIVYSICFILFSGEGMVNTLLLKMGLIKKSYNVLGDEKAVWFFQTAISIWKTIGWNAIIYLAAITGVNQELFDAVEVDGGGRFRKIWHVTVPGILPTFIVLSILQISNILNTGIDQYFVFKNQLVANTIEVLDLYVYRLGIRNNDISYATAVGMLKTMISITLLVLVNKAAKKINNQSII